MWIICTQKSTGKLIHAQGIAYEGQECLGVVTNNAIRQGYAPEDIQTKFITEVEWAIIWNAMQGPIIAETDRLRALKAADFLANLPSWTQVQTAISNIASLADAKAFLAKLSRIVYWLAKNSDI